MSNQYVFTENNSYKDDATLGSAVLVEDGVIWNEEAIEVTLNNTDVTLTENNSESYLTADEGNDTQFFSVLGTSHGSMLNDFGDITINNNSEEEEHTLENNLCTIGGQPDIYRIEDSDELYAFQFACDGDGNIQRFRYRLRANENGEYETIPDSVELLPLEDDTENVVGQKHFENEHQEHTENQYAEGAVFIKQEVSASDVTELSEQDSNDELHVNEEETAMLFEEETESGQQEIDTKAGIIQQSFLSINKLELERTSPFEQLPFDSESDNNVEDHSHEEELNVEDSSQHSRYNESSIKQTVDEKNTIFESELDENSQNSVDSHLNVNTDIENRTNVEYLPELNENESDADEYQIVDGLHITADTESQDEHNHILGTLIQKESPLQNQILKIQQQIPVLQTIKDGNKQLKNNLKLNKNYTFYVVQHPEKENVATVTHHPLTSKVVKANPRSVLKSSYPHLEQKKDKDTQPQVTNVEKRIPKNKEAMQARVLQNLIARTTIIHAPVRQQRLPRKQTIKPVTRADEEIVVQEVVVSSKGFIETTQDGILKSREPIKPTEIVHLSDSDDEYDPKREYKRKKKNKRRRSKITEIVISDSEDDTSNDDDDVVQIDLSADEDNEKSIALKKNINNELQSSRSAESDKNQSGSMESDTSVKRKRGRPSKRSNTTSNEDSSTTDGSSSSKRRRRNTKDSIDSNESTSTKPEEQISTSNSEVENIKTKWKCTKCPKTFPSQGSLKSHMQYHTFHEPSKNTKQTSVKPETVFKKPGSSDDVVNHKYKCDKCGETFKNNILLSRHVKNHNGYGKNLECNICKKILSDRAQLINHKRTHIKEQMVKTTTLPKHSPKSTNTLKSKLSKDKLKCDYCTKVFSSSTLLNSHVKTHKRFTCNNCTASFLSKLVLEDHVRQSCVKQTKPRTSRLSYTTRKSFVAEPQRVSKRLSLRKSMDKKQSSNASSSSSLNESIKKLNVASARMQCDSCKASFSKHAALYKHKVMTHGFDTPDKNIIKAENLRSKTVHKQSANHTSVPATRRLRTAFENLAARSKMK